MPPSPPRPLTFPFKGFTIWLTPSSSSTISTAMQSFSDRLNIESIPSPHLTLVYGVSVTEDIARDRFSKIKSCISSFPSLTCVGLKCSVELEGVDGGLMDMTWAEITYEKGDSHKPVYHACHSIFTGDTANHSLEKAWDEWIPHMSLAYEDPPGVSHGASSQGASQGASHGASHTTTALTSTPPPMLELATPSDTPSSSSDDDTPSSSPEPTSAMSASAMSASAMSASASTQAPPEPLVPLASAASPRTLLLSEVLQLVSAQPSLMDDTRDIVGMELWCTEGIMGSWKKLDAFVFGEVGEVGTV